MGLHGQLVGLLVFFCVLDTITVALRVFVRTTLSKGAFGWDDVALVVTYVGFILLAGLSIAAAHYGFVHYDEQPWYDPQKASKYNLAMNDVCYIISGTIKISVALVLYRLATRRILRLTLIADIIINSIWTIVSTLILSLGCTQPSLYTFSMSVCRNTNYAQEASYIIFDFFHVLLPIVILWDVQIRKAQKWGIVCLFGVGLFAGIAAIMKLIVYVERYHATDTTDLVTLWYRGVIWAFTEHGMSLFAASILALRPLARYISQGWASFSSTFYGSGNSKKLSDRATQSGASKGSNRSHAKTYEAAEMHTIGVRNDVTVYTEDNVENHIKHPLYVAEAYNGSHESQKRLVDGRRRPIKDGDEVV